MIAWRSQAKSLLINYLSGSISNTKMHQTVQKAIRLVAKELENSNVFLLDFMKVYLGLDGKPHFRPYILHRRNMIKMSMQLMVSLPAAYKMRERLLDLFTIAFTSVGLFNPFNLEEKGGIPA